MIEGSLVNLRAPEMADLERDTRWINDREVTQFLSMRYQTSLLAEEGWLRERASKPLSYEAPFFAVDTKDGVHIGNINLFNVRAEERSAELGIMVGDKAYWSQGYGSDALRTLLRFAFRQLNFRRIELFVYAFNARARAAYKKCGFVEEGARRSAIYGGGAYHDLIVMAVLREEWKDRADA